MCKELIECFWGFIEPLDKAQGFIQLLALVIALCKYHQYRERNKADILGKFNERYNTNADIKDVITFIEDISDKNLSQNEIKAKIDTALQIKIDLFFRFFEEIQLSIEAKSLNEEDVHNLFYYYAKVGKRLSLLSDYPKEWHILERFYNRMKLYDNIK